jgi:hypothetical protein
MNYHKIFGKYPEIITAYLFGSRARGKFSALSDYDFAVQVDNKYGTKKYTDLKLELMRDLCRELKTDNIDVVIMNEAPLLLKHRIIRDKKTLFCRSQLKRIRNEARILSEYLDEKEYETAFAKGVFKRILEAA